MTERSTPAPTDAGALADVDGMVAVRTIQAMDGTADMDAAFLMDHIDSVGRGQWPEIIKSFRRQIIAVAAETAALRNSAPQETRGDKPVDLANHRNALKCPYCNPDGLIFAAPQLSPASESEDVKLADLIEHQHGIKIVGGLAVDSKWAKDLILAALRRGRGTSQAGEYLRGYAIGLHDGSVASQQSPRLEREALIDIIMRETTDKIVADGWDHLGSPNVLVQGCKFIRRNFRTDATEGYEDPPDAARKFAGFVADAILALLSPTPSPAPLPD